MRAAGREPICGAELFFSALARPLSVATLAQQWRFTLVPGHPVEPQPVVTLRTKHGMRMMLHRRVSAG